MFRNLGHGSVFIRIERQRRASYRDSHGVLGRLLSSSHNRRRVEAISSLKRQDRVKRSRALIVALAVIIRVANSIKPIPAEFWSYR